MRAVIAPTPTLPSVTLTATAVSQTEIDLVANYPGIPFVVTYKFEYSDNGTTWTAVTPQKSRSYSDVTLAAGQTRSYRVRVQFDGTRITGYSATVSATTFPPTNNVGGFAKKFNPGHYANFNTTFTGNTTFSGSQVQAEMHAIAPYPNVLGYHAKIEWGALEPIAGPTDITPTYPKGYASGATLIKQMRDYLGAMTPPRRLVIYAGLGYVTSTHPSLNDFSVFPQWLQTDSTFGPSGGAGYRIKNADGTFTTTRVSNRFGWWGAGVGQGGNTSTFSFSRPAVLARWIKLWQTLGDYFDSDPLIEGIDFAENSFTRGCQQLGQCPDFDLATFYQAEKDFMTAVAPHWPQTTFQWQNTFENNAADTQATLDWMMANNMDWGATDTLGYTYYTNHKNSTGQNVPYGQGTQAMLGLVTPGSTNYVAQNRLVAMEVEAPDVGAYGGLAGSATPADILKLCNTVMNAHKMYWVVLTNPASSYGASFHPEAQWGALGPWLNDPANALTNRTYPSNYPVINGGG